MTDEFVPTGPPVPATAADLYNAMVEANGIIGEQRKRIVALEAENARLSKDIGSTVTTNDQLVRLRIYDGVIPPDDYHRDMAELERGQRQSVEREFCRYRTASELRIQELEAEILGMKNIRHLFR